MFQAAPLKQDCTRLNVQLCTVWSVKLIDIMHHNTP